MEKFILRASVCKSEQLNIALDIPEFDYVIAPIKALEKNSSQISRIIVNPPIFLGSHEKKLTHELKRLRQRGFERMAVHTIDHIALAKSLGFIPHGSFRLNITNRLALAEYIKMGIVDSLCAVEFKINNSRVADIPVGVLVYGAIPLMVTRRCPVSDNKVCGARGCKKYITDRKANKLFLTCDTACEILNPDVLWLADKLERLKSFSFLQLNFGVKDDVRKITNAYLNGDKPQIKNFTRGAYFKV